MISLFRHAYFDACLAIVKVHRDGLVAQCCGHLDAVGQHLRGYVSAEGLKHLVHHGLLLKAQGHAVGDFKTALLTVSLDALYDFACPN